MTTAHSLYIVPETYQMAQETVANFVCSACWGHLVEHPTDEGVLVLCAVCGEETKGFVSKKYSERRRQESQVELLDAKHILKTIIKPAISGKSEEQNLKELGF